MDIRSGFDLARLRERISKGISGLRDNAPRKKRLSNPLNPGLRPRRRINPKWKSGIVAFLFLGIAGFLAWGAKQVTYSEALKDWERLRAPSKTVWTYALGSHGYLAPHDPRTLQKALRYLPSMMDNPGSVWITADSEWIVVFGNPDQPLPEKLYCRICRGRPEKWAPLGAGWSAFDEVFRRIARMGKVPMIRKKPRKIERYRDLREINY